MEEGLPGENDFTSPSVGQYPLIGIAERLQPRLKLVKANNKLKELQTIIRDRETSRSDFIFCADRLSRLVLEESLDELPFEPCTVTTPTGEPYTGLKFHRGICGVSVMRSGEVMEKGLRECCRSVKIGKILLHASEETSRHKIGYVRLPVDIALRKVLLMYPYVEHDKSLQSAVELLLDHGVIESDIILVTFFTTPEGAEGLLTRFPTLRIITTEIHSEIPSYFGSTYFGTD